MPSTSGGAPFPATRLSALYGARSEDEAERRRSWDALAAAYWKPVYKHLRIRWRKSQADAADLTQAFFMRALERAFFDGYDPERARFRTFVRLCLDRFVQNDDEAARRLKRGGGAVALDIDAAEAELDTTATDPEQAFDREWQRSLFSLALEALSAACAGTDRAVRFTVLERYDLCEGERPSYAAIATELDLPLTTVTNHLAWARRELKRLVLAELAAVSGSDAEYQSEARLLFGREA